MVFNLQHISNTALSAPQAPFCLNLPDGSVLNVEHIVRKVPNKRLVCKGLWQNQAVYAKLFIGREANKYATRDQAGVQLLQAAHIATPAIIFAGELPSHGVNVLIFASIARANNAELAYHTLDEPARLNLATLLVKEIAKHHNAGILQTDCYLKNFLLDGDQIITLDGDGIRYVKPLSQHKALANLSALLSTFDVLDTEHWLPHLLDTYAKERAWQTLLDAAIRKQIHTHRRQAASHYADKKVFRTCTDVKVAALGDIFYGTSREYENKALPASFEKLEQLMTPQNIIKNGNTCTVATAQMGDVKVVIKRYNLKSVWHALSRALRPTRAAKSWANAHRLINLHIATAKPIALVESRPFGLRGKAYFLMEYIDAPDVTEFFLHENDSVTRTNAINNIVELFYRLYLLHISHGDTKASNIKIVHQQPVLIDLDSMQQHGNYVAFVSSHARDLARFMQNWQNDIPLYNAFVQVFNAMYPELSVLAKAGIAINKEIVTI